MAQLFHFLTHPAVLFSAAMLIVITVHIGVMAWLGHLCGAGLSQVTIGIGPRLLSARLGEADLVLRLIPIGGSASLDGTQTRQRTVEDLPLPTRCLLAVSGCAALLALAWLLVGDDAFGAARRTFEAIGRLPFAPGAALSEPTLRAWRFIGHESFPVIVGHAAAVVAAINILPIVPLNGGHIVIWLLEAAGAPRGIIDAIAKMGIVLSLIAVMVWLGSTYMASKV